MARCGTPGSRPFAGSGCVRAEQTAVRFMVLGQPQGTPASVRRSAGLDGGAPDGLLPLRLGQAAGARVSRTPPHARGDAPGGGCRLAPQGRRPPGVDAGWPAKAVEWRHLWPDSLGGGRQLRRRPPVGAGPGHDDRVARLPPPGGDGTGRSSLDRPSRDPPGAVERQPGGSESLAPFGTDRYAHVPVLRLRSPRQMPRWLGTLPSGAGAPATS